MLVLWLLIGDIVLCSMFGVMGGVVNFVGNLFGIVMFIVIGFIVCEMGLFGWVFGLISVFVVIGVLCYMFLFGEVKCIEFDLLVMGGSVFELLKLMV